MLRFWLSLKPEYVCVMQKYQLAWKPKYTCTYWDEMGGLLFSEASSLPIMQGNKNLCPIRKGKGMG
uniref:Uncharacterized protein n=1 Tax=Anguilla anguilla TaxID=7936 RepID=A0A0E9RF57_ANGAN